MIGQNMNSIERILEAANSGDLITLNSLLISTPRGVIRGIAGNVLRQAAQSGDIAVINRILEFPAGVAAIAAGNNAALISAVQYGHLDVVNRLLEFPAVVAAIAVNENDALNWAANNGHLAIVNRLLKFPAVADAIAADGNRALRNASSFGHLDIVNHLLEFPAVVDAIAADHNAALRIANGNIAVINRLLEFPTVVAAITTNNNEVLREAAQHGYLAIVNRLLEFPVVVAAVTANNNEALREAASNGYLAIVDRLLEFPAVVANVTANNNQALTWAQHNGHPDVVERLRQIPAVAAYEAEYPEDHPEDNLAAVAQDEESAIRNLSSSEMEELSILKKRYTTQFQQQGLEASLSGLQKYLIAKYQESPAKYQGKALPLKYDDKLAKEANKEYYQNPYHTAYRYVFCKPNPWMAPEAHWVSRNAQGDAWSNISESAKENIAYLWLAASDTKAPLPAGMTREDIQNRFVDLLADAGRGHNWDTKRSKTIIKNNELVEIQEAFDDLEGDKPSCSLGVTRRTVAQFLLLLQPQVKPLNIDALHAQFMEKLITQNSDKNGLFDKIMTLNFIQLSALNSALHNLVIDAGAKVECLSKEEQILLKDVLVVDTSALKSFMAQCQQDFGERFSTKASIKWQGMDFDSYEKLIQHFAQNTFTVFYDVLKKKCEKQLKTVTPKKPSAPVVQESPASKVPAPLIFTSKKTRKKRQSEVEALSQPFLRSGLHRSARPAGKAQQEKETASDVLFVNKRRCRRK